MNGGFMFFPRNFEPGHWFCFVVDEVEVCNWVVGEFAGVVSCPSEGDHRMCRLFRSYCISQGVNCSGVSSSHVGGGRSVHGWFGTDGHASGSGHGSVHRSGGGA